MNIDDSFFSGLTDEQKKKREAVKSSEEFLALAKEEGYELTPEQLKGAAGGWCGSYALCKEHCYYYNCYIW